MQVVISEDIVKEMESVKAKRDKYVRWLRYIHVFRFWVTLAMLGVLIFIVPYKAYIRDYTDKTLFVSKVLILFLGFLLMVLSGGFNGLTINKELKFFEKNGYNFSSSTYYSIADDQFYFLASDTPASNVLYDNYSEYEDLYNLISAMKKLEGKKFIAVDDVHRTPYRLPVIVQNDLVTEHIILTANKIEVIYTKDVEELTFELKSRKVLLVTVPEKESARI